MRLIDADKLPIDIENEDVDNAPTVDAVSVVRCKDCKYSHYDDLLHYYWCSGSCHNALWFCANGERRKEDEID